MSTTKTGLYLRGTPLNPAFKGTPQEFFEEILAHLDIIAPYGIATFVTGLQMPSSDQGPWLKNNVEWWVFDQNVGTYVPLVLNQSLQTLFYVQEATPPVNAAEIWFQTETINGEVRPKAVNILINGAWKPVGTPTEGTTANRPANPVDFELYYDTSIEAMLVWERDEWRTQSGVKGDTKFVTWGSRAESLLHNPGWEILWDGPVGGASVGNRGLAMGQATQDYDGTNPMAVSGAAQARNQGAVSGVLATTISLVLENLPAHQHDIGLDTDTNPPDGLAAHTGSNYPTGAAEFIYIDDMAKGCDSSNEYGMSRQTLVARTNLTGPSVPTPVSVAQDSPTLWLYCLRKV